MMRPLRTLMTRLVAMLLLALAGSMLADPAMAQSTRVFSNTSSAAINSSTSCTTPVIRTFTVTSNFLIGDVDLGMLASHTFRNDIRVTLQSPAGTRQQLVEGDEFVFVGANFNVRLNDGGTQIVNTEAVETNHSTGPAPPYQHNFIPNASLSVFNGQQSAGVWQLEICDVFPSADDGTFLRADLYLTPATSSSGTGATFVVANTNDSGLRSLRQAVLDANATPAEADLIAFAIPGAGPHTITLSTPLPAFLGAGDMIDGTTQPGASCGDLWAGTPPNLLIHLTAGSIGTGLHLEAANLTVRGLAITGFTNKVYLHPFASNVSIRCNYIGLLPDGTRGSGNTPGLVVEGAGTVIGGLNPGDGNVISGNNFAVWTLNSSTNTAVRGNFIGTNPTGMSAISNERGINHVNGSGSWRDITRNLIAGSTFSEISLDGDDTVTASNGLIRIQSNVIGYNRTLSAKLQAGSASAILFAPGSISNVLIGGDATQGNVIGSLISGIEIVNGSNITIQGNTIAGSGTNGIRLGNVSGATIGGTAAGLGNVIGGNGGMGILLESGSNNITIVGNTIGAATVAGTTANNTIHGIRMANVSNISIGNGTAGGRNIISGNGARAIMGSGTTSGITINGNYIGTDATGNAAVANGWNEGATVRDAISFDQGGSFSNIAVLNNVIGGYGAALVEVWSSTATGVTIQGNSLGVGANGTSPIVSGNIEELIHIGGGSPGNYSNVLIGGTEPGQGNLLANGGRGGIFLFVSGTNNRVTGNTIRNNAAQGIRLLSPTIASVLGNNIFANGGLGIDLNSDGVTLNDPGDGDSGANNLLNFPEITALNSAAGGQLAYAFTLDVPAESNGYRIDFYRNSNADPTGFGEGEQWLGFIDTGAHGGGAVAYNGTFAPLAPVSTGALVSATATRKTGPASYAETSEFNQNATIVTPLVVTNTNDAGAGSLRNAIDFANTQASPSTISFSIPGEGPHSISLLTALPIMTADGMVIDGITQPGAQCRDLWEGNGHDLRINVRRSPSPNLLGLRLAGDNQTVRGLSITRVSTAIQLEATSRNARVQCNYIGLLPNGTNSESNSLAVAVLGASALIGGLNIGEGNVIGGNAGGIRTYSGSTDTSIQGNFIGTIASGMASRFNSIGIRDFSPTGGSSTWRDITGNLIAGNSGGGIRLDAASVVTPSTDLIRIQRNIIGFNRDRSALLLNGTGSSGINSFGGSITNVQIGGLATSEGNLIAGNVDGILLTNAANVTIQGNTIARSGGRGINMVNVRGATIGGPAPDRGNIIGGNGAAGIEVDGGSSNITIQGNAIGWATIAGGTFGNGGNGIDVEGGSNSIAILGNTIGSTSIAGGTVNNNGIALNGVSNIQIGDGTAGGRNIVSGNNGNGLAISNSSSAITVLGNYFGLSADGFTQVGNGTSGITLADVSNVQIGDGSAGGRNIISGNGDGGAFDHGLFASRTTNLTFSGNYVGVAADGMTVVGNSQAGMVFQSLASQSGHINTVVSDNVISGNVLGGVDISSFDAGALGAPSTMTFTGNRMGVAADGVTRPETWAMASRTPMSLARSSLAGRSLAKAISSRIMAVLASLPILPSVRTPL